MYDRGMVYKRTNEPSGRKPTFNRSLGTVVQAPPVPKRVKELLQQKPVKRLLNWMTMDEGFRKRILDQVPEHDPPEP